MLLLTFRAMNLDKKMWYALIGFILLHYWHNVRNKCFKMIIFVMTCNFEFLCCQKWVSPVFLVIWCDEIYCWTKCKLLFCYCCWANKNIHFVTRVFFRLDYFFLRFGELRISAELHYSKKLHSSIVDWIKALIETVYSHCATFINEINKI